MATSKLISTHELEGVRVIGGKNGTKRIGKVRRFVFHPTERRCVGFIVKRPDLLWMFRRKDLFVSIEGYDLVDGRVVVHPEPEATDRGACKALGVNWDACVLWLGLPVMTEDGTVFGIVGNVTFNRYNGEVESIETDSGVTANTLLGKRVIPVEYIRGFRRGMGAAITRTGQEGAAVEEQDVELGALLVSDEVKELATEGGVAEAAGKATAVAVDKVQTTVDKVADKAKPVVSKAAQVTGEAVNKGAYVTGRQLSRSTGMFSEFKEEYDKARGKKPAEEEAIEPAKKPAAAKSSTTKKASGSATKKAAPKQKNMFAAFKEEFDKANSDD